MTMTTRHPVRSAICDMSPSSGFREALAEAIEVYEIPDDDLVGEVLVPAMRNADEVRVGAGFFSSHC